MVSESPRSAKVVVITVFPAAHSRPSTHKGRQWEATPPRIRRLPNTVAVAEPLRAVGTSLGVLHMLTRHGRSDVGEMADRGGFVKGEGRWQRYKLCCGSWSKGAEHIFLVSWFCVIQSVDVPFVPGG